MRTAAVLLILALPSLAAADLDLPPKVGDEGTMGNRQFKVIEIIDKETMLMRYGVSTTYFVLKGYPTGGLADDEVVNLTRVWCKCEKTVKHNGRTYKLLVADPDTVPKPKKK